MWGPQAITSYGAMTRKSSTTVIDVYKRQPLGSEAEQMNLMIGSGDYTDIFDTSYCQQTKEELYADGVIYDLTPYAEQYMPCLLYTSS